MYRSGIEHLRMVFRKWNAKRQKYMNEYVSVYFLAVSEALIALIFTHTDITLNLCAAVKM